MRTTLLVILSLVFFISGCCDCNNLQKDLDDIKIRVMIVEKDIDYYAVKPHLEIMGLIYDSKRDKEE